MSQPSPQEQFTALMAAHRAIILKVIRIYVDDQEDGRDLYQEICYQAWKSFDHFRGDSKFSTWLYRISLNTVLSFRRRPVRVYALENLPSVGQDRQGPKDEVEALYLAIKSLNEIDRMIITLHLDGYSNDEVGEIAGITRGHVAVRLHRTRETLTKKLKAL